MSKLIEMDIQYWKWLIIVPPIIVWIVLFIYLRNTQQKIDRLKGK